MAEFRFFRIIFMSLSLIALSACSFLHRPEGDEQNISAEAIPLVVPAEYSDDYERLILEKKKKMLEKLRALKAEQEETNRLIAEAEKENALIKENRTPAADSAQSASVNSVEVPSVALGKTHTIQYIVKEGDTLMKIAFQVFGDLNRWKEIYELNQNKIQNPNVLVRGTIFTIQVFNEKKIAKNGNPYLIQRGDTLGRISTWVYGTVARWKSLWHQNAELIHDPNRIYAGFNLYYTGKKKIKPTLPTRTLATESLSDDVKAEIPKRVVPYRQPDLK